MSADNPAAPQPPENQPDQSTVSVGNPEPREPLGPDTDMLTDPNGLPKVADLTPPPPDVDAPTEFVSTAEQTRPTPDFPGPEAPAGSAADPFPELPTDSFAFVRLPPAAEAVPDPLPDPELPADSVLLPLLGQSEPPVAEPVDVPVPDPLPDDDALSHSTAAQSPASGWTDYSFIKSVESFSDEIPAKPPADDVLAAPLPEVAVTPGYGDVGGASDVFSDLAAPSADDLPPAPAASPAAIPSPLAELDLGDDPPRASANDESTDSLFAHLAVNAAPEAPLAEAVPSSGTDLGHLPDDLFDDPKAALVPDPEADDATLLGEPFDDIPMAESASGVDLAPAAGPAPALLPDRGTDLFALDESEIPVGTPASEVVVERPGDVPLMPLKDIDDLFSTLTADPTPPAAPAAGAPAAPAGDSGTDLFALDESEIPMAAPASEVVVDRPAKSTLVPNENMDDLFSTLTAEPLPEARRTVNDLGANTEKDTDVEFDQLTADPAGGGSNLFGDAPMGFGGNTSGVNLLAPDSHAAPAPRFPGAAESIFGDEPNEPIGGTSSIFTDDPLPSRGSGDVDQIPLMQSTDHGLSAAAAPSALEPDVLGGDPRDIGIDELLVGPVSSAPGAISFNRPPAGFDPLDEAEQSSGNVDWSSPPAPGGSELVKVIVNESPDAVSQPELDLDDPLASPGAQESEFEMHVLGSKAVVDLDEPKSDVIEPLAELPAGLPSEVKEDPVRAGSAWEVTVAGGSQAGLGSSIMPGAVKPVAPSQSGWMSPSMAGPASGWLSSPGVGPTSGLFAPPVPPPQSPVRGGSDEVQLEDQPDPSEPKTAPSRKIAPAVDPLAEPAGKASIGGWVAGALVGVLLGGGGVAAAFLAGIVTLSDTKPAVVKPGPGPGPGSGPGPVAPGATPTLAQAKALLANGDPVAALPAFEAAGDDAAVDVRAARGQARWMARVRELSKTGDVAKASDAELKKAEADLQKAVDAGQDNEAGVKAALHLGLLKEVTGDTDEAKKVYEKAAEKFPDAKPVFDAALSRIKALAPPEPATKESRLTPADAERLTNAVALTLLMLQADPPAAKAPSEPGFLFWQAVNEASAGDYAAAVKTIAAARKLHDEKRLANVGKGVNPTSDPLEQIFLRACDDLSAYWTLKRDVYEHKALKPLLAEKGAKLKDVLDKLSDGGDPTVLKDLKAKLDKAEKDFKEADTLAKKYETDLTAAKKDLDDSKKLADDAKKLADDAKKLLDDKTKEYDTAAGKLKSAEETVGGIIKELKANKLIPEDTDPAKVPALMKDIAATAASADAKKAAEALLKANKEIEAAKAEVKKAEQDVADAKKAAADAKDDADKKVAAAKAEADKLVAAKLADSVKAQDALNAKIRAEQAAREADQVKFKKDLAAEVENMKKEMAAREERFSLLLAQARAGGPVPLTTGEKAAKERAGRVFGTGVVAYEAGLFDNAEAAFEAATKEDPNDARYWYFLGLTRYAKGSTAPADEAFKKGAELESRSKPAASVISASLERIQGPSRRVLAAHRP